MFFHVDLKIRQYQKKWEEKDYLNVKKERKNRRRGWRNDINEERGRGREKVTQTTVSLACNVPSVTFRVLLLTAATPFSHSVGMNLATARSSTKLLIIKFTRNFRTRLMISNISFHV